MTSFFLQFRGQHITEFYPKSDDDAVVFKCKHLPNSFQIGTLNSFLDIKNADITFTALEKLRRRSFIIIGFKSATFFQNIVLDLFIYLTTKNVYVKVYRSALPSRDILQKLNDKKAEAEISGSQVPPQETELEKFDREFSSEKYSAKLAPFEIPLYVTHIDSNPIEKNLHLFDAHIYHEEISPYREYIIETQNDLLALPRVDPALVSQIACYRSVFESEEEQ